MQSGVGFAPTRSLESLVERAQMLLADGEELSPRGEPFRGDGVTRGGDAKIPLARHHVRNNNEVTIKLNIQSSVLFGDANMSDRLGCMIPC